MPKSITINEVAAFLNEIAPDRLQESYDNTGLIVGNPNEVVKKALICLDCTEAVVEEAVQEGCNLIVAHHPIIFRGLKSITGSNYAERVVINAIKHDIAIFAIHTNLDNVFYHGVNAKIAEQIGLSNTAVLRVNSTYHSKEMPVGSGLIGELPYSMDSLSFLAYLKEKMRLNTIRHTAVIDKKVSKVALCGGAGSFLLQDARQAGAQAYISADFKYHEFFDAENDIIIADIGHYESERFTIDLLFDLISEKFTNFASLKTKVITNPVFYY